MLAPVLDIESGQGLGCLGGDGDDGLLHDAALLQAPDEHPGVHKQGGLLEEALRGGVAGLDLHHELSQLSPLLPLRSGHILSDLRKKYLINKLKTSRSILSSN